jgi:hypothetical protein
MINNTIRLILFFVYVKLNYGYARLIVCVIM